MKHFIRIITYIYKDELFQLKKKKNVRIALIDSRIFHVILKVIEQINNKYYDL